MKELLLYKVYADRMPKSISRLLSPLLLSLMLVLLFSACQPWYYREPLEVMDPKTVRFRLDVDWERDFGEIPSGMTVMLFADHQNSPVTMVSNEVKSRYLDLQPDKYKLIVFNKSVNDFPSIRFDGMNIYEEMTAHATTFTPSKYTDWTQGETFTYDPEQLGTVLEEFEVTEEMLLKQTTFYPYKEWIDMMKSKSANTRFYQEDDLTYVMEVVPQPLITRLFVRVHITNFRNLASVEGHITGFADGWHLTLEHATTNDDTRYLLDDWKVYDDIEYAGDGWMVAMTTLWGEPHGLEYRNNRPLDQHVLTLHLTLQDGSTVDYIYNVGQKVRYITPSWGDLWSYTEVPTKTMLLTIWDRDPGSDPGQPDDPGGITPTDPDDPSNPDKPDDPDNPIDPGNPDDPREPVLPDVDGKDETGKTDFGTGVDPWVNGGRIIIPI